MKNNRSTNLKMFLALLILLALIGLIETIPWWGFVVPVFILGALCAVRGWSGSYFLIGLLCGFAMWTGANLGFHLVFGGNVLSRFPAMTATGLLIVSGIVGGVLTALAFYLGQAVVAVSRYKKVQ
jgi:hypothetical protein